MKSQQLENGIVEAQSATLKHNHATDEAQFSIEAAAAALRIREPLQPFKVTQKVMDQIQRFIGRKPAEQGGMLGGDRKDDLVSHFYYDESASQSGTTYSPDHLTLNELLSMEWNPAEINLLGFVHSHPGGPNSGLSYPSRGDRVYSWRILSAIPELERLLLPIVLTEPDTGRFQIFPYAAYREGDGVRIERLELVVVDCKQNHQWFDTRETYRRVHDAYDLLRMERSRVIYVGVGGAAQFAEDLARAGVGGHVLIDPDIVSETNLATQQAYRRDIGRPKVDCIAERILDINPNATVTCIQMRLDDINDAEFAELCQQPLRKPRLRRIKSRNDKPPTSPARVVICGLTDSFPAQARVNQLALQYGVPSLCAQVYFEGRGAEVTFTDPDTTPACSRCALNSRYTAYLKDHFHNNVTSDGTPIFSTNRLNALKGYIMMAILHHGTNHPRWGGLLKVIGDRNLLQIRMDPNFDLPAFRRAFQGADRERVFCDDVVWLPQKPDCPKNGFPTCPDCGGTGNLLNAKGTFIDTRIMR